MSISNSAVHVFHFLVTILWVQTGRRWVPLIHFENAYLRLHLPGAEILAINLLTRQGDNK